MTDVIIISTRENKATGDREYNAHWCSIEESQKLRERLGSCRAKELKSYDLTSAELFDSIYKTCNDAENERLNPSQLIARTDKLYTEKQGENRK